MKAGRLGCILLSAGLIACTQPAVQPARGGDGPIDIAVWEGGDSRPGRLRAAHIAVRDEEAMAYDLFEVEAGRPLEHGYLLLRADRGRLVPEQSPPVVFEPPVRMSGLLDGRPVLALGEGLVIDQDDSLIVERPRLAWSLQSMQAERLRLSDGERFQGEAWLSHPDEAGLVAVLGALPQASDP